MDSRRAPPRVARIAVLATCALALLAVAVPGASAITAKQLANKALRLDPRKPTNINLFTSKHANGSQGLYPQGSAMKPASGPDLTEAHARRGLRSYLEEQSPNDSSKVNAGMAQFDSERARDLIPDPTLRAAFVGMRGTLLQPTIGRFLNSGQYNPMGYGTLPNSTFIANSTGSVAGGGKVLIIFNNRYEREDFRYLVGIMGHEILHDDGPPPRAEEAILNALSAMTYLQVLSKNPELAYARTELSRQMNDLAILFLHSRENDSPTSEIYAPSGVGVAPGSPFSQPDFWTIFRGDSQTSAGNAPLGQITRSLGLSPLSRYSLAGAKKFANLNDAWLSDVGRAQISVLLQLVSVKKIANVSGLGRSKVISKLRLRPYLNAQN